MYGSRWRRIETRQVRSLAAVFFRFFVVRESCRLLPRMLGATGAC
jgi:hypothetical protein